MARKDHSKNDGQARTLSNLVITPAYSDADYDIRVHNLTRGDTGLLKVFDLVPKTEGNPSFEARVDDGSPGKRRDIELDLDVKGVPDAIRSDFKSGRNGWDGHHTDRSPTPEKRMFDIKVTTPDRVIFEGTVSFSAAFSIGVHVAATVSVSVDAQVIRATKE